MDHMHVWCMLTDVDAVRGLLLLLPLSECVSMNYVTNRRRPISALDGWVGVRSESEDGVCYPPLRHIDPFTEPLITRTIQLHANNLAQQQIRQWRRVVQIHTGLCHPSTADARQHGAQQEAQTMEHFHQQAPPRSPATVSPEPWPLCPHPAVPSP